MDVRRYGTDLYCRFSNNNELLPLESGTSRHSWVHEKIGLLRSFDFLYGKEKRIECKLKKSLSNFL